MQKTTGQRLTRDGIIIRIGVLVVIGVMVLQTLFMSQFTVLGQMTKSAFQRWVGLPCPLCGGTRAMHALFEGDWHRALYLNWIALPVLIIGTLLVIICCIELIFRHAILPKIHFTRRTLALLGLLFIALWVLQIFQSLYTPKPELLNPNGLFFKFYKFPETR
ncbi:MAG: DUF2752 domain-containing protein [Verrucomicrobiales bacterium]|nr:DUF2752 domain-containing protein [Verrucomicrobiales bacterium]